LSKYDKHIFICVNERLENSKRGSCSKCGGMDIRMRFVALINENGLKGVVRANKSGCLDVCEFGPVVVIYPESVWYTNVKLSDVDEIFQSHIIHNKPVERLAASKETWKKLQLSKELIN
tara:strand:+ start:430 stop:786 length:357 start_codon:yes stop_codon:yes gene_type:complete